jgi:hypothetical protein
VWLGDTAYGIPLAGPFIGGGLKTASVLGAIAKANKSKEGIASSSDESSRIQRAKDMGFRTDEPVYHGTHLQKI